MAIDPAFVPIDLSTIRFPSDLITLAGLRRAHPERFDSGNQDLFAGADVGADGFLIGLMMYLERLFAKAAYAEAAGDPADEFNNAGQLRTECMEDLNEYYAKYGMSSGSHQTAQLVRDIESQAASQAASLGK